MTRNKKIGIKVGGRTQPTQPILLNAQNQPSQTPNENNELANSDSDNRDNQNININNAQLSDGFINNDKNKEKGEKVPQRKEQISTDYNSNHENYINLFSNQNKEKTRDRTEAAQSDWLTSLSSQLIINNNSKYINFSVYNKSDEAGMAEAGLMRLADDQFIFTDNEGSKVLRNSLSQRHNNSENICYQTAWKYFSELTGDEEVLTLNQETGKEEWQKPTEKQTYEHNGEMYKIMLENDDDLLVSPEHRVYLSIREVSNPSSFNTINLPSKSSGLDFSLSKEENAFNKDSGLLCGIISNITENILSLGTNPESAKSESFVTNILFSDLDTADTVPFVAPLGGNLTSMSLDLRNSPNLICTFSSNRNLSLGDDDIVFASCQTSGISQSGFNSSRSQGRICFKNFSDSSSCFKHLQNQINHYSCAFESGLSMADFGVNNNPIINFNSHEVKNQKEYLNLSEFQLVKITDAYEKLNSGKEIYFLDSEKKPVKVRSITKQPYSGKIYDVDVPNDIVLVRRLENAEVGMENAQNQASQPSQLTLLNAHTQAPDENDENGNLISDLVNNLYDNDNNQLSNTNPNQLSYSYSNNGQEIGIQSDIGRLLEVSEPAGGSDEVTKAE